MWTFHLLASLFGVHEPAQDLVEDIRVSCAQSVRRTWFSPMSANRLCFKTTRRSGSQQDRRLRPQWLINLRTLYHARHVTITSAKRHMCKVTVVYKTDTEVRGHSTAAVGDHSCLDIFASTRAGVQGLV